MKLSENPHIGKIAPGHPSPPGRGVILREGHGSLYCLSDLLFLSLCSNHRIKKYTDGNTTIKPATKHVTAKKVSENKY